MLLDGEALKLLPAVQRNAVVHQFQWYHSSDHSATIITLSCNPDAFMEAEKLTNPETKSSKFQKFVNSTFCPNIKLKSNEDIDNPILFLADTTCAESVTLAPHAAPNRSLVPPGILSCICSASIVKHNMNGKSIDPQNQKKKILFEATLHLKKEVCNGKITKVQRFIP